MVPRLRYISSIKNQLLLQLSMINWVDFYIELCNIINFLFKNLSHPIIISSYEFGDMFMYFPREKTNAVNDKNQCCQSSWILTNSTEDSNSHCPVPTHWAWGFFGHPKLLQKIGLTWFNILYIYIYLEYTTWKLKRYLLRKSLLTKLEKTKLKGDLWCNSKV